MSDFIEREVGYFPISIGTSLGLEGLFGMHPEQSQIRNPRHDAQQVWVDLRTLVRNFLAAMTTEQRQKMRLEAAVEQLAEEFDTIETVLQQNSSGQLQAVFFIEDHAELNWVFPHAQRKTPNTTKQVELALYQQRMLMGLESWCQVNRTDIVAVRRHPSFTSQRVLLMTHFPHELLWAPYYQDLFLLESHTGKIKSSPYWVTKLHYAGKNDHLPFNRFTLQVLGDGQWFGGEPKPIRDELKALAEPCKWTQITTWSKMRTDIGQKGSQALIARRDKLM